jgi:hypothetical protein
MNDDLAVHMVDDMVSDVEPMVHRQHFLDTFCCLIFLFFNSFHFFSLPLMQNMRFFVFS